MKVYLAAKFYADFSNRKFIEEIASQLEEAGHTTIVAFRDLDEWGAQKFSPREVMKWDFNAIRESDLLLVEFSEKGVGIGIAVGFAKALNMPIVVIAKAGSEVSETIEGTADKIVFYDSTKDLVPLFKSFSTR